MLADILTFGLRLSGAALVVIAASAVLDVLVRRARRALRKRRGGK
jgi:hypothetical protein